MDKLVYVTKRLIFNLQDKVNGLERENLRLRLSSNKQTPITPESLEAIGFEWTNDYKIALCLRLNKHALLVYNCSSRIIGFWLELLSSGSSPVYFASIEQIKEWLKPFMEGEGNGMQNR